MFSFVRFFIDGIYFFRTLTVRKVFNLFLIQKGFILSQLLRKPVVLGLPHTLSVEPGTFCNLSCPECPVGTKTLKRGNGTMSFDRYRQIVDQTAVHLIHIMLYFQGEPFLSSYLFDFIRYAKRKNIYVSTSTNGHYLTAENISGLLDSGLDRLIISLDGATADTYKKYRIGGDFSRVVRGIGDIVKTRNSQGFKRPYIIVQFIYFRYNLHEINAVKNLVRKLGADALQFKTAQFYNLDVNNSFIPKDAKYSRYVIRNGEYVLKYKLKNSCPRLWNTVVITWDGRVVPCCFDKDAEYVMGEVDKNNFSEIWFSQKYRAFRFRILTRRSEIDICRNCTEGLASKI